MVAEGDVVQAYVEESNDWVYAKVRSVNEDGTYDVKLETGGKLKGLAADCVAPVEDAEGEAPAKKEKKKKKEKKEVPEEEQPEAPEEEPTPTKKEKKKKKEKKVEDDSEDDEPAAPSPKSPTKTSPKAAQVMKIPGMADGYVRPAGAREVKVGRWSSYEKLGMCFEAGTMVLAEVVEESPAERCKLNDYIGWRLSHVDGRLCQTTVEVKNVVGDRCNLTCTFTPLNEAEKADFERRLAERKAEEEQKKQPPAPVEESKWKKDADVPACEGCKDKFSLTKRRHHCRQCGGVFCGKCTPSTRTLQEKPKQRVCTKCDAMLKKFDK